MYPGNYIIYRVYFSFEQILTESVCRRNDVDIHYKNILHTLKKHFSSLSSYFKYTNCFSPVSQRSPAKGGTHEQKLDPVIEVAHVPSFWHANSAKLQLTA